VTKKVQYNVTIIKTNTLQI